MVVLCYNEGVHVALPARDGQGHEGEVVQRGSSGVVHYGTCQEKRGARLLSKEDGSERESEFFDGVKGGLELRRGY